ncbi:hypothetical protein [Sagittula stellata]|uniref:Alpha-ketoglutarate decarboxylase n=1 Tax=Sagittula stellata (strain ATCC 700073 / DSM 11524 / E-37) TaxID=388399 RepID=A3K3L5_SAGS3|nr:hypothetical protein [Sagittula stellata]EBA08129.1 alpha-ketoglutarate decarboxylase [Sagittula stellata E-37]
MMSPEQPKRRVGLRIIIAFVGVVGAFILWDELVPRGPVSEGMQARLRCVAKSVALHQALFSAEEEGIALERDFREEFDTVFNGLQRFQRGLVRRDDPGRLAFRPIMIQEEDAKDAAMAEDPQGYLTRAWAELQACYDALFLQQSAGRQMQEGVA